MTQSTHFEQLLTLAGQEPQPQRLLFVFLKAVLPDESSADKLESYKSAQGGQLKPIMTVDKELSELTTFDALVEESKGTGKEWQIVLIAALAGSNGVAPTSKEAEEGIETILKVVQGGGNLSPFMALDRDGDPINFN